MIQKRPQTLQNENTGLIIIFGVHFVIFGAFFVFFLGESRGAIFVLFGSFLHFLGGFLHYFRAQKEVVRERKKKSI